MPEYEDVVCPECGQPMKRMFPDTWPRDPTVWVCATHGVYEEVVADG